MTQTLCFFATDLHGRTDRYEKLFAAIEAERPAAVFLGGDLLPSGLLPRGLDPGHQDFVNGYLAVRFGAIRERRIESGATAPEIFLILGNDDGRSYEAALVEVATRGLWTYAHNRRCPFGAWSVYGYAYIPPTPFVLKDWERYDVSRYVDPGCTSPEEGFRSVPVTQDEARWSTIARDLARLAGEDDLRRAIFLFHSPPYDSDLDRAELDGKYYEHVPLDVHIGSIAIRRFLEDRGPHISLHGHVHESARITGAWKTRIGRTLALSAAHDGPELALVRFDPGTPEEATRELL